MHQFISANLEQCTMIQFPHVEVIIFKRISQTIFTKHCHCVPLKVHLAQRANDILLNGYFWFKGTKAFVKLLLRELFYEDMHKRLTSFENLRKKTICLCAFVGFFVYDVLFVHSFYLQSKGNKLQARVIKHLQSTLCINSQLHQQ